MFRKAFKELLLLLCCSQCFFITLLHPHC